MHYYTARVVFIKLLSFHYIHHIAFIAVYSFQYIHIHSILYIALQYIVLITFHALHCIRCIASHFELIRHRQTDIVRYRADIATNKMKK